MHEDVVLAVEGAVVGGRAGGVDAGGKGLHAHLEPGVGGAVGGEDLCAGGVEGGAQAPAHVGLPNNVRVDDGAERGEPAGEAGRREKGVVGGRAGPADDPGPGAGAFELLAEVAGRDAGDGLELAADVAEGQGQLASALEGGLEPQRGDLDAFLGDDALLDDVIHGCLVLGGSAGLSGRCGRKPGRYGATV